MSLSHTSTISISWTAFATKKWNVWFHTGFKFFGITCRINNQTVNKEWSGWLMIHAVTLKWMSLASCWLLLNLEHLLFVQVFWVHATIPNYYQKQGAIHKCSVSFPFLCMTFRKSLENMLEPQRVESRVVCVLPPWPLFRLQMRHGNTTYIHEDDLVSALELGWSGRTGL